MGAGGDTLRTLRLPTGGWRPDLGLCALSGLLLVATGCRNAVGEPLPERLRSKTFCVERQAEDARNLSREIAASFQASGADAAYTEPGGCTADFAYLVTYIDQWSWDLRDFLFRLTIEVADAGTGEIVAYGESMQDSAGALGTSRRDVIDRAVAVILGGSGTDR